jgi:hypothetical protein
MTERVVLYQLTHKFVNKEQDIPEDARQVIYYSLAIGHHVGVLDCFKSLIEIPLDAYRQWINLLPEGTRRQKLEGVLKWGEIEINQSHANELLPLLNEALSRSNATEVQWATVLIQQLGLMKQEPAVYLMVRKCV